MNQRMVSIFAIKQQYVRLATSRLNTPYHLIIALRLDFWLLTGRPKKLRKIKEQKLQYLKIVPGESTLAKATPVMKNATNQSIDDANHRAVARDKKNADVFTSWRPTYLIK